MAEDWSEARRTQEADDLERKAVEKLRALLSSLEEKPVKQQMTILRGTVFFAQYLRRGDKTEDGDEPIKALVEDLRELRAAARKKLPGVESGAAEEAE